MKNFSEFRINESAGTDDIKNEIIAFFARGRSRAQVEDNIAYGKNPPILTIGARYWGTWEVPSDVDDDGDYDWEILSDKSAKELKKFETSLAKKYKKFIITFSTEEKNWIIAEVRNKLKKLK